MHSVSYNAYHKGIRYSFPKPGVVEMRTPASIAGHPIHPMLVPVAIGGFVISFAFDLACIATNTPTPNVFNQVAYYTMLAGIVGALALRK